MEWQECLVQQDIPVDMKQVNQNIEEIASTINTIENRQEVGDKRMKQIDSMVDKLKLVFNN